MDERLKTEVMDSCWIALILFGTAFVVSLGVFPFVLRFAKRHQLVDNPNERKLQRVPVPVIGGTAVFAGILVAMVVAIAAFRFHFLWMGLVAMALMWMIGTWDDLRDIPAMFRFLVEIVLVWMLITFGGTGIDDFHGLWGLQDVSLYYALPLSIVGGVGIINAINLMDGVDGYCSGFCTVASLLFSVVFFVSGDVAMGCFALVCAGALMPFILHNVFGTSTKMYIGDGGSLMIGTALTVFVFGVLSKESMCSVLALRGLGLVPFTLAVLAIPIFDTLRVMGARIMRGRSPFLPDKTHLHHLFIEMGFSHAGTTVSIIFLNLLIVLIWFLAYKLGASINWQLYIVVFLGVATTFGFYRFMKLQQAFNDGEGTALYRWFTRIGEKTHIEKKAFWRWMRYLADHVLNVREK